MKIQSINTFIRKNYPGISQPLAGTILRDAGYLMTTQTLEHASVLKQVKPRELAEQAVAEFEGLDPALDGIEEIIYYVVPETKESAPAIIAFYKKDED